MEKKTELILQAFRMKPCVVCGDKPSDPCHIKTKGSGGPDEPWNLLSLCRKHHTEQHQIGIVTFIGRYRPLQMELHFKGWKIDAFMKLWHPKLCDEMPSYLYEIYEYFGSELA